MTEPNSKGGTTSMVPGREALVRAVERLARPLVRLLLDKQITFPFVAALLKRIYVDVAERDFALEGRRQTDSRISLLTGIQRRDVRRLRASPLDEASQRGVVLGALVVSRWTADPVFLDESGRPRPLSLRKREGSPSFEDLVVSVSTDIPPRSMLDEWLRLGVVDIDAENRVVLRQESFVAPEGLDEKLHFFGRNLRDHIEAGVHNVRGGEPPFFDRSVFYDDLRAESVEELRRVAAEEGAELLRRINQRALRLQNADRGARDANKRMTVGAYFLRGDVQGQDDE